MTITEPKHLIRLAGVWTLILTLLCSTALAASARDPRQMDEQADEGLKAFVNLLGGACLLRDVRTLPEYEDPSDPLLEGLLLLGLSRGLLPRNDGDPSDTVETLSLRDAQELVADLFVYSDSVAFPLNPSCPCITVRGETVTVDYGDAEAETAGGARIFSIQRDGGALTVWADVYSTLASWETDPLEVSEDCLTWEYTARYTLERAGDAGLGFRLTAMEAYPEWESGGIDTWQEIRGSGFSFILPPGFSGWSADGAENPVYGTEDGGCVLSVDRQAGSSLDVFSRFRADALRANPEARVVMEPALHYASAETPGEYTVLIAPENGNEIFTLTLRFPQERQYECSFIGEMIRNSFWCEGVPMG